MAAITTTPDSIQAQKRKALQQFEAQLTELSLGKEQIDLQTLPELEASPERVNDALTHPESFGVTRLIVTSKANLALVSTGTDAHFEIGIMPLLLERKKQILDRIRVLKDAKQIENLRDMIEKVQEIDVREKLEKELAELKARSHEMIEQSREVEKARIQAEIDSQEKLAKLEMEMRERRARIFKSFLEKESVASIIGGMLVLVLAACLIIAMFTNVQSTEILNNAFLIILGYFFGQTVARAASGKGQSSDNDQG